MHLVYQNIEQKLSYRLRHQHHYVFIVLEKLYQVSLFKTCKVINKIYHVIILFRRGGLLIKRKKKNIIYLLHCRK